MLPEQRHMGREVLLAEIRRAGSIPRIDLSEITGISRATVTTITAELINYGLVAEIPVQPEISDLKRGRPKVNLKINAETFIIAGMKVTDEFISTVCVDFEGNLIGSHVEEMQIDTVSPNEFVKLIHNALDNACKEIEVDSSQVSALGIGLAGVVDVAAGFLHWSPLLNTREVYLQKMLSDGLSLPVFIDNDANLVAKAEQHFGHGRSSQDFLVVTIESGVGLGIILNNELYRGTRGCGAEFGHTKVQLDGALCRCGQRGCLEAYVANYALLREAAVAIGKSTATSDHEKLRELVEKSKSGDVTAQSIFNRAARMFAMGLANLVNIFDPELIILAGEHTQFDFLDPNLIIKHIQGSVLQLDSAPPEVIIHKWDASMWARGAAAYAIEGIQKIALERFNESAA
jgi:predicted NBD/HSP70 family sugar kinase